MKRYYFLHIPRTGGGTLRKLISAHCADGSWLGIYPGKTPPFMDLPTYRSLAPQFLQRIGFVIGEIASLYSHADTMSGLRLTLIREPVARTISQFQYHQKRGDLEPDIELKDIAASKPGWASNLQTRLLCGAEEQELTEHHLSLAKARLKAFHLVGATERFTEFYLVLADLADWSATNFVNSFATAPMSTDPATETTLREMNRLDHALWRFANELQNNTLASYGRSFFETRLAGFQERQRQFQLDYTAKRQQRLARHRETQHSQEIIGFLDPIQRGKAVTGWVYSHRRQEPFTVSLLINNRSVAKQQAVVHRQDLYQLGMHATGLCGFRFREAIGALRSGDRIQVVADGGRYVLPPGVREVAA
ncbi:MAG: hypothetical protein ACOY3Z_09185 [Thermodesulfobacteriota bacterium]